MLLIYSCERYWYHEIIHVCKNTPPL
jgi:hypothetical protein